MIYWLEDKSLNLKLPQYFADEKERESFLKIRERLINKETFNVDFSSVEKLNTLGCLILSSWWNHSIRSQTQMKLTRVSPKLSQGLNKLGLGNLLEQPESSKKVKVSNR